MFRGKKNQLYLYRNTKNFVNEKLTAEVCYKYINKFHCYHCCGPRSVSLSLLFRIAGITLGFERRTLHFDTSECPLLHISARIASVLTYYFNIPRSVTEISLLQLNFLHYTFRHFKLTSSSGFLQYRASNQVLSYVTSCSTLNAFVLCRLVFLQ
jgi:hypothetical protein